MRSEPPAPSTWGELVHRIEEVRFTPVRLRKGYDMRQVDELLDGIVESLQRRQSVRSTVEGARFTPVRLREGYDMGEVDQLLDLVAVTADRLAATG